MINDLSDDSKVIRKHVCLMPAQIEMLNELKNEHGSVSGAIRVAITQLYNNVESDQEKSINRLENKFAELNENIEQLNQLGNKSHTPHQTENDTTKIQLEILDQLKDSNSHTLSELCDSSNKDITEQEIKASIKELLKDGYVKRDGSGTVATFKIDSQI